MGQEGTQGAELASRGQDGAVVIHFRRPPCEHKRIGGRKSQV